MNEFINWWQDATLKQREDFLEAIGAYQVSDNTWYVHPSKNPCTIQPAASDAPTPTAT